MDSEVSPLYHVADAWSASLPRRGNEADVEILLMQLRHLCRGIVPMQGVIIWPYNDPVPRGWKLCDGSDGTVDLRGYVLVGDDVAGLVL